MAAVILVHGIAQEQRTADSLENQWLPALAGGVRVAGFTDIGDRLWRDRSGPSGIDARMAFYGHLFLRPERQGAAGIDAEELDAEQRTMAEGTALEWLQRAAIRAPQSQERATAARELAYVRDQVGQETQGTGGITRAAIQSVARVPWFSRLGMDVAKRFVSSAVAQVTTYLTDDAVRQAALRAVLDLMGPDTRVVIGHSLGSVVAYEAAHQLERSLPLLLTLGSPLGLATIVYPHLRPQPPRFPPRVKHWINIAARDDFVAAEPDLTHMFSDGLPTGSTFDGGYTVDNGARPHCAEFYLGKVEIGRPVGQILSVGQ